jgi:hypothetical protein
MHQIRTVESTCRHLELGANALRELGAMVAPQEDRKRAETPSWSSILHLYVAGGGVVYASRR